MRGSTKLITTLLITQLLSIVGILLYVSYASDEKASLQADHEVQYSRMKDSLEIVIKTYSSTLSQYRHRYDSVLIASRIQAEFDENLYKLNWDNVCYWIDKFKIKNPDIVKAQILLETNYLQSNICLYNRNLFGMKYFESIRKGTVAIGSKSGHAYYTSYVESIYDYKLWQERYFKFSEDDYFQFLKRIGYAEDPNYINKLKWIMKHKLHNFKYS